MDVVTAILWVAAGASGGVGWSGEFECLPLALGVLFCWRLSRSAIEAFGVALAYYAAAGFGLVKAASTFFGAVSGWSSAGVLSWVGVSVLLAIAWGALWSPRFVTSALSRVTRGAALGLVLLVPPLGLIGGANPWIGGAAMLPGLGYLGLVVVTVSLLAPSRKTWPAWAALFVFASVFACRGDGRASSVNWSGVSTHYGTLAGRSPGEHYDVAADAWRLAAATDADLVLFPEGLAGAWTASSASLWALEAQERETLWVVGAMESDLTGHRNGVGVVGRNEPHFWSQRLPAPIGMWAPWRTGHVQSDLFRRSVEVIDGRRVALLLCFEQFVAWPAFQSAIENAEVVLAPANLWFAHGTNLNAVREVTLKSWGALMGWTVVEAING